jgi:hypothetical protein
MISRGRKTAADAAGLFSAHPALSHGSQLVPTPAAVSSMESGGQSSTIHRCGIS